MKVKRLTGLIMALVLTAMVGAGQTGDFAWGEFAGAGNRINGKLLGVRYDYDVYGNAFYFYHSTWFQGTITTTEGDQFIDYSLRYDALHDALIVHNPRTKGFFVADKDIVASFSVETPGGKQRFIRLTPGTKGGEGEYYEILYEGGTSLYCRNRIVERNTSMYKNMFGELDNRKFDLEKQYLLRLPDHSFTSIAPGKNSITTLFPDRKREIRRFVRQNFVLDKTPEGMAAIIRWMDQASGGSNK